MKNLKFKDLQIGMPVEVDYSGSKYFIGGGGGAWHTGAFHGHVEAVAFDWVSIRDSNGNARVATAKDGGINLNIKPYDENSCGDDDE